jgi:DNA-binding transcriptional regulator LsrR (DeoR family)
MADVIKARHFPMPLPVLVSSAGERELLHAQALVRSTLDISAQADVTFVGIGEMGIEAPLCLDGFLEKDEMLALMKRGAAGEICGWVFDGEGKLMPDDVNDRVASAPLPSRDTSSVIGIAKGRRKFEAIKAAVVGRQINGLITDEAVAEFLLRA